VADQAAQALHDRRTLTVTLIVVSGAPGTGKSTIAAALGASLRFPVLSLDPIKEALADALGLGAGLIEVDTGASGAAESAVTAVRSALSL
jgi:predicted kinase